MKLVAYIDGGSRGNPGEAALGVYMPGVVRMSEYLGHSTNNYAEYAALLAALRFAVYHRCVELHVCTDSELVARQIKGTYRTRHENIRPLYEAALRWKELIPRFSIEHIRREENREADRLANRAMDARAHSLEWLVSK